jgi:hypothetical protein
VKYLEPESVDRNALVGEFCQKARPNCDAFVTEAGGCGCAESAPAEGDPMDLCRDIENVSRCLDDVMSTLDLSSCGCQPLDSGRTPFGGTPGCQLDPKAAPGARDAWLTIDYDDVFLDRRFDVTGFDGEAFRDVLMYQPGYTAAVSPGLFRSNFVALGDRLSVDVYVPAESPATGYFGAVQAYCTRGNTINRYLGQVEIEADAAGNVQPIDFALTEQDRQRCFGGDDEFRLTFAINSDVSATSTLGVAGFDFEGTLFPVDRPSPLCPDPTPEIAVLPPTVTTWTFPDGQVLPISELIGPLR